MTDIVDRLVRLTGTILDPKTSVSSKKSTLEIGNNLQMFGYVTLLLDDEEPYVKVEALTLCLWITSLTNRTNEQVGCRAEVHQPFIAPATKPRTT